MELELTTWYLAVAWGFILWHFTGFDDFINLKENVRMSKSTKSAIAGFLVAVAIMIIIVIIGVYTVAKFTIVQRLAWMACGFPLFFAFMAIKGDEGSSGFNSPQAFTLAAVTFLLNSFDDIGVNFSVCIGDCSDTIVGYFVGVYIGALSTVYLLYVYERYKDRWLLRYLEMPVVKAICLFGVSDYIITTKIPIEYLHSINLTTELLGFVFFPLFCLITSLAIHFSTIKKAEI